ncbi:hypothetical protein GCM10010486_77660 [Nonomuraea roseoviolacea subsp. carminata]
MDAGNDDEIFLIQAQADKPPNSRAGQDRRPRDAVRSGSGGRRGQVIAVLQVVEQGRVHG